MQINPHIYKYQSDRAGPLCNYSKAQQVSDNSRHNNRLI